MATALRLSIIFTLCIHSLSAAITVSPPEDVWAVNISGLKFDYSLDCSIPTTPCIYTWRHGTFTTVVQRLATASCGTTDPDYLVECLYPSSSLVSTFTIVKRLSVSDNNTEVVVTGTAVSGVTPIVIQLDYCNINDLVNADGVSLSPELCDFNCVSKFSCTDGFTGASADLTCQGNASWSQTDLTCERVSCNGSSCDNCCELNSSRSLSSIGLLSYNESVTAQCCEGFFDTNNGTGNFTCTKPGSIAPDLNCIPVVCPLNLCTNCCFSNSEFSDSTDITLLYDQSVNVKCCVGFNEISGQTSLSYTCNSSQSIDANLTCSRVRCNAEAITDVCGIGCVHKNVTELSYGENITLECDTDYVSNITVASCIGLNELDGSLTCTISSVNTHDCDILKQGIVAGIIVAVLYTICIAVCIILLWVSSSKGHKLHGKLAVVVASFVLFAVSLGLCFGLNDATCNFTTGGIGGLVVGIIAIIGIIVCNVWMLILLFQVEEKQRTNGSNNSPSPVGRPGKNNEPAEEDFNMISQNENL